MQKLLLAICIFSTLNAFGEIRIYSTGLQKYIGLEEFTQTVKKDAHYVLGEYHYNEVIQKTQAWLIEHIVTETSAQNDFTVGWEFLLYRDQKAITDLYNQYQAKNITGAELMKRLGHGETYLPILEVSAKFGGEFLALNEAREIKRYISKGGLVSLPSEYQVPMMELGSQNYLKRFMAAMGGHGASQTLMNYYEAQCFTDSVMAYRYSLGSNHDLRFTIVGSFHSDFFDGYVAQLPRYINQEVVAIKIVNANEVSADDELALTSNDPEYGAIADYVIFAD